MTRLEYSAAWTGYPHGHLPAPVAARSGSTAVPILAQVAVAVVAIAVRFAAPGWLLLLLLMGVGLIGLAPFVVATAFGVTMLRRTAGRWRAALMTTLAALDLALLTFAFTLPDITDDAGTNFVPVARLFLHQGAVSEQTATTYGAIANWAALCYVIAAAGVVAVAVARWLSARSGHRYPARKVSH
ncbi:hypothetical protein [Nocardia macrotermitis]|nr:hypothetical protein [Nocardia macrotermitis]